MSEGTASATEATATEGRASRAAVEPISRVWHIVDVAFLGAVVATVVYWVSLTPQGWVYIDDWKLAGQARTIKGIFAPYNGHLSIVILAIYRVLLTIFGYSTYLPFRIAGAVCLGSVSASMYLTLRRRIGIPLALFVGVLFLWPSGIAMEVCALNHWLALAGAIWVAFLLNRRSSRGSDLALACALSFALSSADGGVAAAAAAVAFCVVTRPRWKRWVAVMVPTVSWALWWGLWGRTDNAKFASTHTFSQQVQMFVDSIANSTTVLTFGHRFSNWVLLAIYVAWFAVLARRGIRNTANFVAWSAAVVIWWAGVVWFRSGGFTIDIFRYNFLSAGFIVLALVPVEPIRWHTVRWFAYLREKRTLLPRPLAAPIVAVVIVLVAFGFGSYHTFTNTRAGNELYAAMLNKAGVQAKETTIKVNKGPAVVPDSTNLGILFYSFPASMIRHLVAFYGGMPTH